jgi:thiol-disulfide isomerase/thioredoxin
LELLLSFISAALPRIARLPVAAALLYAALGAFANPAPARDLTPDQRAELTALRDGDMRKLVIHEAGVPAPDIAFTDGAGVATSLAASDGRIRLVNFWATWCAPCRVEMPALDALERDRGGPDFAVIPIATGRNNPDAIARFVAEAGVADLPSFLDPKGKLAAAMNVPGLPVTVVLDRDGDEIARMLGGADWNSPSAHAIIDYLAALPE